MKFSYLLLGGFLIFAILVAMFGIYVMTQLTEISEISFEVSEASEISQAALDFNVENFHTQLEVWEYAYAPSDERLLAYQKHDEKLTELLNNLLEIVEIEAGEKHVGKKGIIDGGEKQVKEIADDLEKVRDDWVGLLESIGELKELTDAGYDDVNSENHNMYDVALKKSKELVIANEDLFDELDFNNEIDKFVVAQKELVEELHEEQKSIISRFMILFTILITILVVLSIGMVLFISYFILKPVKSRKL